MKYKAPVCPPSKFSFPLVRSFSAINGDGHTVLSVLPFDNFSSDPEQAFFADGLAEDLITRLSTWRAFPVIARNSSFQFRGGDADLKHVSKALGARYNAGDRFCSD